MPPLAPPFHLRLAVSDMWSDAFLGMRVRGYTRQLESLASPCLFLVLSDPWSDAFLGMRVKGGEEGIRLLDLRIAPETRACGLHTLALACYVNASPPPRPTPFPL